VASGTRDVDDSNEQAMAGEFAQRVVLTWLAATREGPEDLLALVKDAQLAFLPEQPFTATDLTVARIEDADGVWSVTVAATVTDARDETVVIGAVAGACTTDDMP
jgi:hypothetical protein